MMEQEAHVMINGVELSEVHSMMLRCVLSDFVSRTEHDDDLIEAVGAELCRLYGARTREILAKMLR